MPWRFGISSPVKSGNSIMQIGPQSKNICRLSIGDVLVKKRSTNILMSVLDAQMHAHIPRVTRTVQKSNLPWLNNKCRQAVAAKHEAEGGANYNEDVNSTSEILRLERAAYMQRLRSKMEGLPRNSKQWWSLNKRLLDRQAAPISFFLQRAFSKRFVG